MEKRWDKCNGKHVSLMVMNIIVGVDGCLPG